MKHKLLTAFAVATSIFVFTENKLPNNNIKAVIMKFTIADLRKSRQISSSRNGGQLF